MGRAARAKIQEVPTSDTPIKLDFGCGSHKREGFAGVDRIAFDGVDHVMDVRTDKWPWADNSVAEAHAAHFIEHLTALERIKFANELYRILVPGGQCSIIVPHWCSNRAYGDPTHQWPPVSEMWLCYLNQKWRDEQAPHTDAKHWKDGYSCNFDWTYGYGMRADLIVRNQDFQQFAFGNFKEAAQDMHATIAKPKT